MSVKVMGRVWDSDLEPRLRYVLLAYADAAEHDGTQIWPGRDRLVEMTGYTASTIERITKKLLEVGVLVRVSAGYRGRRAEFRIDLDHPSLNVSQSATQTTEATVGSVAEVQPFTDGEVSQSATLSGGESVASEPESVANDPGKCRTSASPPVLTSRPTPPVLVADKSARDLLWETLVELHGEPATKSERGKLNRVRKQLAEADVDETEYPTLVAAYMAKFSKAGSPAPQPTAMTIAQRVGELRHFILRGPIGSPAGTADELAERRRHAELLARQEAEERALEGGN